jgi:hypothetical protein
LCLWLQHAQYFHISNERYRNKKVKQIAFLQTLIRILFGSISLRIAISCEELTDVPYYCRFIRGPYTISVLHSSIFPFSFSFFPYSPRLLQKAKRTYSNGTLRSPHKKPDRGVCLCQGLSDQTWPI